MLQADLDNADIQLELWQGIEYCLDEFLVDYADHFMPIGETNLVLCEAPQQADPGTVQEGLKLILEKGFVPLVAHPERSEYFSEVLIQQSKRKSLGKDEAGFEASMPHQKSSKLSLASLWPFRKKNSKSKIQHSKLPVRALPDGVMFQANLGSFSGFYGPEVQMSAYQFLKAGVYACLATDLHEGNSASKILQRDKFDANPLLKSLVMGENFAGLVLSKASITPQGPCQEELFD